MGYLGTRYLKPSLRDWFMVFPLPRTTSWANLSPALRDYVWEIRFDTPSVPYLSQVTVPNRPGSE